MLDLGDRKEDSIISFLWSTNNKSGASITRATNGQVRIYKDDNATQSTAGITDTEDFDGLTGIHLCKIDTSADAFYEVIKDYTVVLQGAVIDGETVNAVLATFSIEKRSSDIVRINGHRTNQNLATLKLAQLDIWSTEDIALRCRVSSELGNIPAISAKGTGSAAGMLLEGGDTGEGLHSKTGLYGVGMRITGASHGLYAAGGVGESGGAGICAVGINGLLTQGNSIDILARELGTKFNIDGITGAGILEVLKKIVDDSGGVSYDATTDSLEKTSTKLDDINSIVSNIQNNTRCVIGLPSSFIIPGTSFSVYKIILNFYNSEGTMEDPDGDEFAILVETANAVSKVGLLYKEYACTNLLDVAPNFTNYKKLVKNGTGQYCCYVKIASTEIACSLVYDFACNENSNPLHFARSNSIDIPEIGDVTLEDNTINKQIIAGSLRSEDISAIPVVDGSILKDLQIDIGDIPTDLLTKVIDGMTLSSIFELIAAMVNGRIRKDFPSVGDLTFFKRNNSTVLTVTHTTSTERTRVS